MQTIENGGEEQTCNSVETDTSNFAAGLQNERMEIDVGHDVAEDVVDESILGKNI